MIYVLAFFLPPLALMLNGQIFAAIFNAVLFVAFLVIGLLTLTPFLWLIAPAHAIIDYAVHHLGARGALRPKVFKWRALTLAPGETLTLARRHSMKPVTTRRYYAGGHEIDLRINGRILARTAFELLSSSGAEEMPGRKEYLGRYR